jgi:hypothetical protein
MKKIILFLLALVVFIGCNPEDIPETKGKLDPTAMILIKPAKGVQLRSTVSGLTALEIVEQAFIIKWQTHWAYESYKTEEPMSATRGFPEELGFKDFDTPALKMQGIDVISEEGDYQRIFTHAFSVYIADVNNDTIAYIPDQVIADARPLIEAAYEDGNYNEVYRLFNEAFTFLPM